MARKKKFQIDPEPKPDLTPMIDIVFNLIIFFHAFRKGEAHKGMDTKMGKYFFIGLKKFCSLCCGCC